MADIEKTIQDRAAEYGDYQLQAGTSQSLKSVMFRTDNWAHLGHAQRESLEMIAVKISRILHGNINHRDSWCDIEGYAALISREL